MELVIRHQFRNIKTGDKNFYITNFFYKLFQNLEIEYPDIKFRIENQPEYEDKGQGSVYSCMNFSIINPENQNYILFSFFDNWKYHFMKHLGWNAKNMKKFFYPGGFNFLDYFTFKSHTKNNFDLEFPIDIESVYEPFYYGPYFDCCYDEMSNLYQIRNNFEKIHKLFFRGWMWDFRKNMTDGLNQEDILIIDKNIDNENFEYVEYLNEISKYKACLSLPGGNEVCNRDIECFAVGVPVIRPALNVNYVDPLIPNYHYISCYDFCDYTIDGHAKYQSYDDFKKNLVNTWNKVKNDDEYLNFVSKNARDWFERNCISDNNLHFVLNNLDLSILK